MEHVAPVSAEVGARALEWNTMKLVLNRSHSFGLEFVLNKARLTPTKHSLRKHRKLSKVIFWLAKLPAPTLQKCKNLFCSQSRLIRVSLLLFFYLLPAFSQHLSLFSSSILFSRPSVLMPFLLPPLWLRTLVHKLDLWFSPLLSHDTDSQIQKYKPLNSMWSYTPL